MEQNVYTDSDCEREQIRGNSNSDIQKWTAKAGTKVRNFIGGWKFARMKFIRSFNPFRIE